MSDSSRELLVFLEPDLADQALAQLRAMVDVTQVLLPRLVLVRADPEALPRVSGIRGVADVHNEASFEHPPGLSSAERLFVSAWQARQQPKIRPGEGRNWDAPGFLPPDPPDQHQ
jgi:hypothetical protein